MAQQNVSRMILATFLAWSVPARAQDEVKGLDKRFAIQFNECSVTRVDMTTGKFSTVAGAPVALVCETAPDAVMTCTLQAKGGAPAAIRLIGLKSGTQAIVQSDDRSFHVIINLASSSAILRTDFQVDDGQLRGAKTCSGQYFQEDQPAPPQEQKPQPRPKRLV